MTTEHANGNANGNDVNETQQRTAASPGPPDARRELNGWLYTDAADTTPPALKAFYADMPTESVARCERARKHTRDAYVQGWLTIRDELHQQNKFLTEYCKAAGVSYNTVKAILSRHDQATRQQEQQSDEGALHPQPSDEASTDKQEQEQQEQRQQGPRSLTLKLPDAATVEATRANLRLVLKLGDGITDRDKDNWAEAINSLFDFWWEHAGRELEAQAAHAAEQEGQAA